MEKLIEYQIIGGWIHNLDAAIKGNAAHLASQNGKGDIKAMNEKSKLEDDMEATTKVYKKLQGEIVKHFKNKYELKLNLIK